MKLPAKSFSKACGVMLLVCWGWLTGQSREPVIFPFKQSNTILIKTTAGMNFDNDEFLDVVGIAAIVDGQGALIPRSTYLVHLEESPGGDFNLVWRFQLPLNVRGDFTDLRVTDFDGDGTPDLIAVANISEVESPAAASWLYIFGYRDGFSEEPLAVLGKETELNIRPRPAFLDIGDWDSDGKKEIVISSTGPQRSVIQIDLKGNLVNEGLQILKVTSNLSILQGILPFRALLAEVDTAAGLETIIIGGRQEFAIEVYQKELELKPRYTYVFKNVAREDFDINNIAAADLDGDGLAELLIPLKTGGAYLVWRDKDLLRAALLFPSSLKIKTLYCGDINGNRLADILIATQSDGDILCYEYSLSGSLAEIGSYRSKTYSHPLLKNFRFLSFESVCNSAGKITGAIIAPFWHMNYEQHGLIYWWLEEKAPLSDKGIIEQVLQTVDSTLAKKDTQVPQKETPPSKQLSESEQLRQKLSGIVGEEAPLAPLPLGEPKVAVPPGRDWRKVVKPDVLTHPGELVQYTITIPGLSLDDTKNLNVQVETPPGMRFDLANKTFFWTPADTQLGLFKINATFSWGGRKEGRSFTVYVNKIPKIISQIPARDIIQIGETFHFQIQVQDENPDAAISYKLVNCPGGTTINAKGEVLWKPTFDQADWYDFLIEVSDGYDTDKIGFALFVNHPVSIETTAPTQIAVGQKYSYQPRIIDNNKGFYLTDYGQVPRIVDWKQTGVVETRILDDAIRTNIGRYIERYRKAFPMSTDLASKALFQEIFEDSGKIVFVYNLPIAQGMEPTQIVNAFFTNLNMTPPRFTAPVRRYLYKFSLKEAPVGMSMSGDGVIEWTPKEEQFDYQSFSYTVSDGFFSAEEHAQVYVNYPPRIISIPDSNAYVNTLWQYEIKVKDLNTDSRLTYGLLKAPEGMVVSPQGIITWRPTDLQLNNHTFTLRVSDGMAQQVQRGKVFVNAKPRILSVPKPVAMTGLKYEYQLEAEDPNGDPLVYKAIRIPKYASFDPATGLLTWTPRNNQKGVNDVVIEVGDNHGWSTLQEFQIHVFHNPSAGRLTFLRDTISLLVLIGVILVVR